MTDAEAATDGEVAHNSMIEGPWDEPRDGTMSLHDLHHWVITEGGRFPTTREIAEEAIRRHGVTDFPWFTALPEKEKISLGVGWAIEDANEAICRAHTNERIHLLGIEPGLLGPPQRIPPDGLRGADLDILGGQPMSDQKKIGRRREYGEINQICFSGFIVTVWTAVCVDKREVREAFHYGRALSAAVVDAPSKKLDTSETRRAKPGQKSLAERDRPLLDEMKRLMEDGRAQSVQAAARQLGSKADGHGVEASKIERLAKRYRRTETSIRSE
jgi:hypothetical protein